MDQKLMAVWEYDQPPFYLAGEIGLINKEGKCQIVGHDLVYYMPVKILPYDEEKIAALKEIERGYHDARRSLVNECKHDVEALFCIK